MRFTLATIAFYATLVLGQTGQNAISIPQGQTTLDVTAGQSTTIQWTNPSSGNVDIMLQYAGNNQLADSGITLASGIPASAGSATFTIPANEVTANGEYTIVIIDDTSSANRNYAPAFTVAGATGTASLPTGGPTSTGSSSASSTGSASTTGTDSSSTTSSDSSSSSSTGTASSTSNSSSTSSSTSSSSSAAATTQAPSSSNGAGELKIGGAMLAMVGGVAALL